METADKPATEQHALPGDRQQPVTGQSWEPAPAVSPVCSDVPKDLPLPLDNSPLWGGQPKRHRSQPPLWAAREPLRVEGAASSVHSPLHPGCTDSLTLRSTFLSAYSVPETWPLPAQSQGPGVEEGDSRVNGQLGQYDFTTPPSPGPTQVPVTLIAPRFLQRPPLGHVTPCPLTPTFPCLNPAGGFQLHLE